MQFSFRAAVGPRRRHLEQSGSVAWASRGSMLSLDNMGQAAEWCSLGFSSMNRCVIRSVRVIVLRATQVITIALVMVIVAAWLIAATVDFDQDTYEGGWFVHRGDESEVVVTLTRWNQVGSVFYELSVFANAQARSDARSLASFAPSWGKLAEPPCSDSDRRLVEARGWPLVCLWCEYSRAPPSQPGGRRYAVQGGIPLPLEPAPRGYDDSLLPRVLPTRPLWGGLLVNVITYSTMIATLVWLTAHCRRTLRRRWGRCPVCNYDVRGTTGLCPECGTLLRSGA